MYDHAASSAGKPLPCASSSAVLGMQSLVVLMADDTSHDVLLLCWQALVAVAGSIPKEMMPSYVRTLKEAVSTAKEKERRKRRPLPIRVAGFCLPKALQPVLPIFLQGVLQVRPHRNTSCCLFLNTLAMKNSCRLCSLPGIVGLCTAVHGLPSLSGYLNQQQCSGLTTVPRSALPFLKLLPA